MFSCIVHLFDLCDFVCRHVWCFHLTRDHMFSGQQLSPVYTIQPVVKRGSNGFDNQLYRVYKHSFGCQTGLTTGWMFVYPIQPAVEPVVQLAVSCKWGFTLPCSNYSQVVHINKQSSLLLARLRE